MTLSDYVLAIRGAEGLEEAPMTTPEWRTPAPADAATAESCPIAQWAYRTFHAAHRVTRDGCCFETAAPRERRGNGGWYGQAKDRFGVGSSAALEGESICAKVG